MEEKNKENEEMILQLSSTKTKEDHDEVPLVSGEEQVTQPMSANLEAEGEGLRKESEKNKSPSKKEMRVEIIEPSDLESENPESESRDQLLSKQSIKGPPPKTKRRSSLKEIGRSLKGRRASLKERRISIKEASEKGISEEQSSKTDMSKQSSSHDQPTEAEEAGNERAEEQDVEDSVIGGTSKPPPTGEENEETTISYEPDVERKKPKKKAAAEEALLVEADSKYSDTNEVLEESGKQQKKEESMRTSLNGSTMSNDERGKVEQAEEAEEDGTHIKLERLSQGEAETIIDLQSTKDEIINEIKKWGDPDYVRRTIDEQKTALAVKVGEIQQEIQKLELAWKDMGFFESVVSAVAALKMRAQHREMDESNRTKKRRLELRAKELENENKRREKRLDRIQSQVNELDYLLKEKEIDEAEYGKRKKLLDSEKAAVDGEVKGADEELHQIPELIKIIEKSESPKRNSVDPETGLVQTKLQLEKQVEQLNNHIAEKKLEFEGKEPDDRTTESQAWRQKTNEEVKTLEQMRNNLEDELVGINKLLERIKGPRQRMVLWGAVATVAMIYLYEFSNTFTVVH